MLSITNNQQPTFQAKLKTNWTKMPEMETVAKRFEEITHDYKHDVFDVVSEKIEKGDTHKTFRCTSFFINGERAGFINTFGEFKLFCREHSPEHVAKTLAKFFKVGKLTEKASKQTSGIYKNLKSASLTLFRAENGPKTRINQVIAENASKRIATLKKELADIESKRSATQNKILKDEPINFYEESNISDSI